MPKACFQPVWFELYGCLNGRSWFSQPTRKPVFP